MSTDTRTVFDLIATINDHRRFLEAAALGPGDSERRNHYRRQSQVEAMTVAKVTRRLAQRGDRELSSHELESYVDSLIDAYTDDRMGPGALEAPRMRARPQPRKRSRNG